MSMYQIAAVVILCLIQLGDSKRYYYPDTKDPNAIVFDGPTNAEFRKRPDIPPVPGEDYDYGEGKIDPKFGDPEDDN